MKTSNSIATDRASSFFSISNRRSFTLLSISNSVDLDNRRALFNILLRSSLFAWFMVWVQWPCIPLKTISILSVVRGPSRARNPHELVGVITSIFKITLYILLMSPLDSFARCAIARVKLFIIIARIRSGHVAAILILLIQVLLQAALAFLFHTFNYRFGIIRGLNCTQILRPFLIRELRQQGIALLTAGGSTEYFWWPVLRLGQTLC